MSFSRSWCVWYHDLPKSQGNLQKSFGNSGEKVRLNVLIDDIIQIIYDFLGFCISFFWKCDVNLVQLNLIERSEYVRGKLKLLSGKSQVNMREFNVMILLETLTIDYLSWLPLFSNFYMSNKKHCRSFSQLRKYFFNPTLNKFLWLFTNLF